MALRRAYVAVSPGQYDPRIYTDEKVKLAIADVIAGSTPD